MKLDFTGIINFNKKFKRAIELKDKKEEELKKSNEGLEKLEQQLNKLQVKEYELSSKTTEEASLKLEENKAKQEDVKNKISQKKEKIVAIDKLYQKYLSRFLKLNSEKESAIYDLNLKIAKIEDKLDELRKNWNKAADKINENYAKMRKMSKDSQEYKDLEEENEKYREVMRDSVITSETGIKLKNELEELKNMKRILENGEIIEELVKPKEDKKKTKEEQKESEPIVQEENKTDNPTVEEDKKTPEQPSEDTTQTGTKTEKRTVSNPKTQPKKEETTKTVVPEPSKEPTREETKPEQPKVEEITVEPQKAEEKATIKPYSEMTVEELKKRQRELFAQIVEGDDFHYRAHEENGMNGHDEDWLDKELKAVREELEKRARDEQEESKESPVVEPKMSFFSRVRNAFKNLITRFRNRNQEALPAPEMTKEQQEEYVDRANEILEETVSNERILNASTRRAMRKRRVFSRDSCTARENAKSNWYE